MVQRCSNGVAFLVLEPEPTVRTGIRVDIFEGANPLNLIASLPDTWGRRWTDPIRGAGSGEFWVAANHPAFETHPDLLAYGNIARFRLDGRYRFAIVIEAKTRVQTTDEGDVARTLQVSGRGILAKLEDTQLYPAGGLSGSPEREFVDATAGQIMGLVVTEGKARGGLVGVAEDYGPAVDSNNAPYAATVSVTERAGTSGLRIAERIQELAADVYMTPGGALRIVNTRGIDRSQQLVDAGPVVLRIAGNLEELTRTEEGSIRNTLLIETPAGFLERVEGASSTQHGRREAFLSLGNITDTDAVDRSAEAVFQQSAQPAAEIGAPVADVEGARPYVDWGPGDWVLAPNAEGELERVRVRALTVAETDEGEPLYVPELASITEELEHRLERWLAAMDRGTLGGTAAGVAEPVKAPVEVVEAISEELDDHVATHPHPDELSDLADVDITGLNDRDVLRYDATAFAWEPEALELDALDDVDLTTAPTNGQVLTYDDGAGLWKPATPSGGGGGGGGAVLLGSHSVAGSEASITFTGLSANYRELLIRARLRTDRPSSDNDGLRLRLGDGSIDSGSSAYAFVSHIVGSITDNQNSGSADHVLVSTGLTASTAPSGDFGAAEIRLVAYATASQRTWVFAESGWFSSAARYLGATRGCYYAQNEVDQLRLLPRLGSNFTAGEVEVWGLYPTT